MSTARAIYARLTDPTTGVPSLCPDVWAMDADDGVHLPRIVYDLDDVERDRTYQGATGLLQSSVEIDCIAAGYADAQAIGRAVVVALDNQRGTWGGVSVAGCFYRGGSESHESPGAGVGPDAYTRTARFDVWIRE